MSTETKTIDLEQMANDSDLSVIGYKILLDRYCLKEIPPKFQNGDMVLVQVNGNREVGIVCDVGPVIKCLVGDTVIDAHTHSVTKLLETSSQQVKRRVAKALAVPEGQAASFWEEKFYSIMERWEFVPGGRILANAGTGTDTSLYNCMALPSPHDSRDGILEVGKYVVNASAAGMGIGINISTLRPRGFPVVKVNGVSSGAVTWGNIYSELLKTGEQGGTRRSAGLLLLEVWHPDILEFITGKRNSLFMNCVNLSVGITDKFMDCVIQNKKWDLIFPDTQYCKYDEEWDGDIEVWMQKGYPIIVCNTLDARQIWDLLCESAWVSGEPGVIFLDRVNQLSNSSYYNKIRCCNACSEQPLPFFSVCTLGAINLSKMVINGEINYKRLAEIIPIAVRFLDNVIDVTPYQFVAVEEQQKGERRIGLGTMGLADMLIQLGVRYGSQDSIDIIDQLFRFISMEAYQASMKLAIEKGCYPKFVYGAHNVGYIKERGIEIGPTGIRNVTCLTSAPTGSTGTLVNTSTGIEPYYSLDTITRHSRLGALVITNPAVERIGGGDNLPDYFVDAYDISVEEHIKVLAAIQKWIDGSQSKTVNLASQATIEDVSNAFMLLYTSGCKGGTIYRDGSRDEQVLNVRKLDRSSKKKRPEILYGNTRKVQTPVGNMYMSINRSPDRNEPVEIFIQVGKSGSVIKDFTEALARLISLILQIEDGVSATDKLLLVAKQLIGIGGSKSVGFGRKKILSLPDAVAKVIYEDCSKETVKMMDVCPSCGLFELVHEDGCEHCMNCGYSVC